MKAILVRQFGGPEVLKLEEVPDPTPGPRQVIVKTRTIGVNPVDTYIRSGTYAFKPPLPYTPGADAAGVIKSIGAEVKTFKPGDRVWVKETADAAHGRMSENPLQSQQHLPTSRVDFLFAGGCGQRRVYHRVSRTLPGRPGSARRGILVHGATGGVGIACVQLAVARGLIVIGTGGTEAGGISFANRVRSTCSITPRRAISTRLRRTPTATASMSSVKCSPTSTSPKTCKFSPNVAELR